MSVGSLEAALRERAAAESKQANQQGAHTPGLVHRPVVRERVPSCEQAVNQPERMRLWGRCGFVPESKITGLEE